ncbi:hypothetical protein [Halocatena marina]|uniref:hypothetical protein n=1 Tax=Halocatena marina TaxID=2934937 RepID=UPI00200D2281|nr:hypothetical protein [Halocatena marina]
MTDADNIIATIESDPSRFDEHVEDLRTILESGETDARRSVTKLLGDVAGLDPQIGTRHPELLELAFDDTDSIVRGLAIDVVAIITKTIPEEGTDFVPHLATALTDEELTGSSQMDGIATLGVIDRETDKSISEADEALASLLRDAEGHVRETAAINLDDTVKAAPREFPSMLRAFVSVLDDPRSQTRLRAAETLTTVAYEDVEALNDVDEVLAGLKELRSYNDLPAERVEKMINITEVGAGYAEE